MLPVERIGAVSAVEDPAEGFRAESPPGLPDPEVGEVPDVESGRRSVRPGVEGMAREP